MTTTDPAPAGTVRRFDSPQQAVYLALWRTYDRLRAIEDELFGGFDLTAQQYNVLRLLKAEHPYPVPTLSLIDKLISKAPDITRMLDKLEARGLVARTRSRRDRRTVLVGVTAAGLKLLDQIAGPLQECHERQLGHLADEELKTLFDLLKRARGPHEPDGSLWK